MASKPFAAIDGESFTVDGEHRYVLLMVDSGKYIFDREGLSTRACFEFLLSLPKTHIYTAFGLNYDVNMILRDFGRERLEELWSSGRTRWHGYTVEWIPGKWFYLRMGKGPRIKINEVFGFFQCSFIKALEGWKIRHPHEEMIEEMKGARSEFNEDMTSQVIDYCNTECILLVQLMEELRMNFEAVDILPTSWNGAGSAAATMLRKQRIKDAISAPPDQASTAILSAYFGGRTELFKQGEVGRVVEYDICSAYPYAALSLPDLSQGEWIHAHSYDPLSDHAIWRLYWQVGDSHIAPFPHRYKGSRICYPGNGSGWYHAEEVRQALRIYPSSIRIHEGWVFEPSASEHPFSFIEEIYRERQTLKAQGHAAEKCLKLSINSLYGKLAQGVGYRDSLPPYQSYFWAGEITARTRARLLHLMGEAPEDVVMVATDAIFYDRDIQHPTGKSLGDLDKLIIEDMFTAQPGVYCGTVNGDSIKRSRGFFAREIDFDQLRAGFRSRGSDFVGHYESTRFHGLGTSLMARELSSWRTWQTADRKLSLSPSTKRIDDPTAVPILHVPPQFEGYPPMSLPYTPKGGGYSDDQVEYAQGKDQPLRGD